MTSPNVWNDSKFGAFVHGKGLSLMISMVISRLIHPLVTCHIAIVWPCIQLMDLPIKNCDLPESFLLPKGKLIEDIFWDGNHEITTITVFTSYIQKIPALHFMTFHVFHQTLGIVLSLAQMYRIFSANRTWERYKVKPLKRLAHHSKEPAEPLTIR